MNTLEKLENMAMQDNVTVIPYHFDSKRIRGLYCDGTIALNANIETTAEKSCVLAEELGHYHTTFGDIIEPQHTSNIKQECRARLWAYNCQIGLRGIINAYERRCRNLYEMADYLDVTEDFLKEAITAYRNKYGICTEFGDYVIFFEPHLAVLKKVAD